MGKFGEEGKILASFCEILAQKINHVVGTVLSFRHEEIWPCGRCHFAKWGKPGRWASETGKGENPEQHGQCRPCKGRKGIGRHPGDGGNAGVTAC